MALAVCPNRHFQNVNSWGAFLFGGNLWFFDYSWLSKRLFGCFTLFLLVLFRKRRFVLLGRSDDVFFTVLVFLQISHVLCCTSPGTERGGAGLSCCFLTSSLRWPLRCINIVQQNRLTCTVSAQCFLGNVSTNTDPQSQRCLLDLAKQDLTGWRARLVSRHSFQDSLADHCLLLTDFSFANEADVNQAFLRLEANKTHCATLRKHCKNKWQYELKIFRGKKEVALLGLVGERL